MSHEHPQFKAITSLTNFFERNLNGLDKEKGFIFWFQHDDIPDDIFGITHDPEVKLMRLGNFYVIMDVEKNSPWNVPVQYCANNGILFTITFNSNNENVRTNKWYFSARTPTYLLDHSLSKIFGQEKLYPSLQYYIENELKLDFDPSNYDEDILNISPISSSMIMWSSFDMPLASMPEMHAIESANRKITVGIKGVGVT